MWTKIVQLKFLKKIRNFTKHPLIISDNIYISQNAGPGTCLILLQRVRQIVHNLYRDIPASVLFEQAIFISTQTSKKKNENNVINSKILWIPIDAKVKENLVRTKAEERFGLQNFRVWVLPCFHGAYTSPSSLSNYRSRRPLKKILFRKVRPRSFLKSRFYNWDSRPNWSPTIRTLLYACIILGASGSIR